MSGGPGGAKLMLGIGLLGALALGGARHLLESSMAGHMLVQVPLLVGAGCLVGAMLDGRLRTTRWNEHGVPGVLLALLTIAYWLLPRSLDVALDQRAVEAAKFLSLPLLAGVPLALSWPRLPALARSFLWAHLVAMLEVMGWVYSAAPVRLCASYAYTQQATLGHLMSAAGLALGLVWAMIALLPRDYRPDVRQLRGEAHITGWARG